MCPQMHFNSGYQREAIPLVQRFVDVFRDAEVIVAARRLVSVWCATLYPMAAEFAADPALIRDVGSRAHAFELTEFLVKQLQVEDVGVYFPHHLSLIIPRAIRCVCCVWAMRRTVCCAPCAGLSRPPARRRAMLRLWRHLCY